MKFKNLEHEQNYKVLLELTEADNKNVETAMYVLAAIPEVGLVDFVKNHIHGKNAVDFVKMIEETSTWNRGKRTLLQLAAHFFNPDIFNENCTIMEVFPMLDVENFNVAIEAIKYRTEIKQLNTKQ